MPRTRPLALALLLAACLPSWAARPLATDDAGVIAAGDCEVEASRVRLRSGDSRETATGAALACGWAFGAQTGVAYGQASGPQGRARSLALTAKAGLWQDPGEDAAALAVSGAMGWARGAGQDWEREGSDLRLIGTLPLRYGFVHVNLGHARPAGDGPKATLWGLALEHRPATVAGLGWAPLAEVYGDDRGERWMNLGIRTTVLADRLFLDLAHARQQAPAKARVRNAGLRFAF